MASQPTTTDRKSSLRLATEADRPAAATSGRLGWAPRAVGPNRLGTLEERFGREFVDRLVGRVTVADGDRRWVAVQAPFTGETLGEVPEATAEDVVEAARRGRDAQRLWKTWTLEQRAEVFLRLHDLILDRQEEVLDLIQVEAGKARVHAYEEVADVANVCRYYAHHAEDHLRSQRRMGALPGLTATWEHHHPRGLIGFISPWNYPLSLAATDAIPALMAGNAVLLKPDSRTPFTALWVVDLLYQAGLPSGLFQVVTGAGRTLGEPLIEHSDFLTFTGSTATGRKVAAQAGQQLIGCALELGGKNPAVVLADADLDRTADGLIRGCFANAGQLCISFERVYVHRAIFDDLLTLFAERVHCLRVGADLAYGADMGSLMSQEQLDKVQEHLDDAVEKGATVVVGGRPRPDLGPYFFEPTVLTGVEEGMKLYREETFGPVVAFYPFDTVEEAVTQANDTSYGLNASLWTEDTELALELAVRLEAGTVNINEAYAAAWGSVSAPMGGYKDSGVGRRHGAEGILKYTESQTVAVQRLLPVAPPPGVSHRGFSQMMSQTLRWLRHVPGLR
ncbi:MAG: succinic semialdehyde dehydrogenase [Acidobacteriota bacterium]|nr:succinic semialdehyde dehydrogenase [Acidobacteriota bacterium]